MIVAPEHANQAADVVNGLYEKHRALTKGDVVLDIGAHVGYFAMTAALKVAPLGLVYAFEPHPLNYAMLAANCADMPTIRPINAAAWDRSGEMDMYPMPGNSGGHSLFPFDGHAPAIKVAALDIGRWIMDEAVQPTFVKIDAENSEENILRSLLPQCRPEFAIEIHNASLYGSCSKLLKDYGYTIEPTTHSQYLCYAWL